MADSIARLIVTLEAQTATYQKGLENANRQLEGFKRTQQQTLKTLESGFDDFGKAIAAVFTVEFARRMGEFVVRQVEAVKAIGESAEAAGIGAEQFQRLTFAIAELTTASRQIVERGLNSFNLKLGQARDGSKQLQESARALGIDLTQNTNVAIEQAFEGLSKIADTGRRAALAGDFFGDRFGPKLAGAIGESTENLHRLEEAATGIISEANVKKADKLNEEFAKMKGIVDAQMADAVLSNADSFEALAKALGNVEAKAIGALAELTRLARNPKGEFDFIRGMFFSDGTEAAGTVHNIIRPNPAAGKVDPQSIVDQLNKAGVGPDFAAGQGPNKVIPAGQSELLKSAHDLADQLSKEYENAYKKQYDAQIEMANEAGDEISKRQLDRDKKDQEEWERMTEGRMDDLKKGQEQAAQFGDFFVQTIREASDYGFKGLLRSFTETLAQMILKAQAAKLWETIFGKEGLSSTSGGFIGGAAKLFGFASGGEFTVGGAGGTDSQTVAFRATPGERVSVGGGGGGVNIVQNIDARGSSNPQQMAVIMKLAKDSAKAEIQDSLRRRSR